MAAILEKGVLELSGQEETENETNYWEKYQYSINLKYPNT